MKTRQSGMPPENAWAAFFDPATTLVKLGLSEDCDSVVDFGCGYGTFAAPAANIIQGIVHAIDLDPEMIAAIQSKAADHPNLSIVERDFVRDGSGLTERSVDYVMLFNILHAEEAPALLHEARRILKPGGTLAVMHWNYDPATPRGPSMDIRLTPDACQSLVARCGYTVGPLIDLPPYHYGFTATPIASEIR